MAIDWTRSMRQSFEYVEVSPATWCDVRPLRMVRSCSITYDQGQDSLGSASMEVDGDVGELYVRAYLVAEQDGARERVPLGTFLAQSAPMKTDGKKQTWDLDCYTPLHELAENAPPLGYSLLAGTDVMASAYAAARDNCRAPVSEPRDGKALSEDFVANADDTWLSFVRDLAAKAGYHLTLDPMGQIGFAPDGDAGAMQPTWTYADGSASIVRLDAQLERDLYGVPNEVEVVWSGDDGLSYVGRARNDLEESPASTVARGRTIARRITDPDIAGTPTQSVLDAYAAKELKELSSAEYTATYSHGYNGVRVGDCVRLRYRGGGIMADRALVTAQTVKCETGIEVSETATWSETYWG